MLVMLRLATLVLALHEAAAGHCGNYNSCSACAADANCGYCTAGGYGGSNCQMYYFSCSSGAITSPGACPADDSESSLPGEPFFEDATSLLASNPSQRNYGVAVTDTNGNGKLEFVVTGFAHANQAFEWDAAAGQYVDVASATVQDSASKSIGVAACDVDGDGNEELYILNTGTPSLGART